MCRKTDDPAETVSIACMSLSNEYLLSIYYVLGLGVGLGCWGFCVVQDQPGLCFLRAYGKDHISVPQFPQSTRGLK